MNKLFKSSHLLILALLFTAFGCNNDDDEVVATITEINLEDFSVTIDENPSNGFAIGTVPTDGSGPLSFSITSQTPAGALSIASGTGELTVANAALFDFEANPVITASVTVVNAVSPATVTVNLTNINELSIQDFTMAIDENPTNGQVIGTLQADGDATLSFSVASQTPTGALSLDQSTGELTVADATLFDFETNPVITADITVDNSGNMETLVATINLTNVNEVSAQDFSVTIDENPTDGQSLGTIQANGDGVLTYSITTQSLAGALNINATTGGLTVMDPNLFDFETNPVITATISVDNSGNSESVIATINLTDVDEIVAQNLTTDIDENPTNGQVIGALQASAGGTLSYTITFQSTAGAVNINSSTGELTVADASLFNFETTPSMFVTISVNNGTYSVSSTATITIQDLNELGEYKFGGIIFWLDSTDNSHGLVCALNNQMTAPWGCLGTTIGGTSTAMGTGASNTAAIVASGCASGSAAEIVSNLTLNGYNDWFLPSLDELTAFGTNYQNYVFPTVVANGGSAFNSVNWSSSEVNSNNAYLGAIAGNPSFFNGYKSINLYNFLPVRAF